jgi:hypothetical protein
MSKISATEIRAWLATAPAGEAITYFRGFLALAREEGDRSLGEADTPSSRPTCLISGDLPL